VIVAVGKGRQAQIRRSKVQRGAQIKIYLRRSLSHPRETDIASVSALERTGREEGKCRPMRLKGDCGERRGTRGGRLET